MKELNFNTVECLIAGIFFWPCVLSGSYIGIKLAQWTFGN